MTAPRQPQQAPPQLRYILANVVTLSAIGAGVVVLISPDLGFGEWLAGTAFVSLIFLGFLFAMGLGTIVRNAIIGVGRHFMNDLSGRRR